MVNRKVARRARAGQTFPQWYSDCKCWTCFAAAVWYTRNFILSDATHDTHSPKFCTLQPLLAQQAFLFFSLMQPMSPTTTKSAAFRKPTGAYQRKTRYIVAAVKRYVFVVPPPPPAPGGNRHFVTVPLPLGGGNRPDKRGEISKGGGYLAHTTCFFGWAPVCFLPCAAGWSAHRLVRGLE